MVLVPLALAAMSPLLQWRQPVYIAAGFAGIIAMCLLLLQPLLAGGLLPGLTGLRGRRLHRWTGALLVTAVLLHVAGLFVTSPPDVIDALLFRSPTPFSAWGVIAMGAVLATVSIVFGSALTMKVEYYLLDEMSFRQALRTALADLLVPGRSESA